MNEQPKVSALKEKAEPSPVRITDASPYESIEALWVQSTRVATMGIFLVVGIAGLYFARSILMPVAAAVIVGVTLSPIQKYATRYRIPPALTAILLVALFVGALWLAVVLLADPANNLIAQAPDLVKTVKEKLRWLERPMSIFKEVKDAVGETAGQSAPTVAVDSGLATYVQHAVTILTPALSEFIVFFGTLLFFLVGTARIRKQLIFSFGTRDARLRVVRIWNDVEHNLISYLGTVTVINLGLGIVTAAMLYVLGFPGALPLGLLAFVLNYIPYLGPAMVVLTLFLVGLISMPSLGSAVLPPLLFVAIATVEGHFITPSIVGRRLTLSPFLVFLALAFWTWLWGPVGTFMATPILIVSLVVMAHVFPQDDNALPG